MATLTTLNAASPLNASDATRANFTNGVTTEVLSYALDNVDADFSTMDTLTFSIQYRLDVARDDDTYDLSIRIVNGATILAAANSGGTFQSVASNITTTTDTYNTATAFTYVNTAASKATWDGATVELQSVVSKSKGWDAANIQLNHAIFNGTYTTGVSNTNVPLDSYGYNATGYSGNASYFIPVSTGAYTLSGQTLGVSLETNTNVPLNTGAYTLAGQTLGVTIADNTAVPLDSYGYSLTGNAATINIGDAIELTGGAYTLAGQTLTVNTTATTTVPLDSYGYNLTGYSGTASYYIPVLTGAYTVNGQTLSISTVGNTDVPLDAFAYALSGLALGVVVERPVALDAGAYTVAGQSLAVNTIGNTTVALDSYGYNLTGYSGTASYYIPVSTGAYTVAGQTLGVTLDTGVSVPLDAGAYTLAGYELAFTPEIVGGTGDYVLAGQTLGVTIGADVTVPLDAYGYTLTGLAATIAVDDEIALDGYGYTLAGQALGISSGVNIVADAGSYTVTGNALNITVGDAIGLDAGAYTLTGNALGVSATGDTAVTLDAGAYTLTGLDATLSQSATTVSLDAGAYTFAGKDIASQVGAADTDACREPVQIVEIVQPLCANVFGSAPCTATGTADQKCYNTRATCQDTANYDGSASLSLFFSSGKVAERGVAGANYIIPSLVSVSTAPTRVNLASANPDAQGLGNRAVCSLTFNDHPHTDRRVDPYQDGRTFDPYARGSFWSKWLVRNKYRQNIVIKVYEGYAGEALSEMTKRTYFLESATGPTSNGKVTIRGKDILARIEERKAQAPLASPGELYADITNSATSFELANAVEADYPASGTIRINDEIMTYTGRATSANGITLTGVTRGTDGTTADEHSAEDAAQECLRYTSAQVDDIVSDLLTTYGGVPSAYLDTAGWATEVDTYLSFYRMSIVISEPTGVTELVSQLQENVLFYIWWDERDALVKMKAIRGIDAEPPTITAEFNILEGSFSLAEKPRERVSRAWVFYQHRNYVDSLTDADSYRSQSIFANLESETDDLYGEASVRKIYAPWIQSGALADTTASKILTRFVDIPTQVTLSMDAKDRDYWVGDIVKISHYLDVDSYGERQLRNWTIIQAEETTSGEIVEYTLEDTTLYGRIHYVMAGGTADYPGASAPFKNCYIGDASGLLSDGTSAGRIN